VYRHTHRNKHKHTQMYTYHTNVHISYYIKNTYARGTYDVTHTHAHRIIDSAVNSMLHIANKLWENVTNLELIEAMDIKGSLSFDTVADKPSTHVSRPRPYPRICKIIHSNLMHITWRVFPIQCALFSFISLSLFLYPSLSIVTVCVCVCVSIQRTPTRACTYMLFVDDSVSLP
jgi:hypothetical protein